MGEPTKRRGVDLPSPQQATLTPIKKNALPVVPSIVQYLYCAGLISYMQAIFVYAPLGTHVGDDT